jgi:hypothetical protein
MEDVVDVIHWSLEADGYSTALPAKLRALGGDVQAGLRLAGITATAAWHGSRYAEEEEDGGSTAAKGGARRRGPFLCSRLCVASPREVAYEERATRAFRAVRHAAATSASLAAASLALTLRPFDAFESRQEGLPGRRMPPDLVVLRLGGRFAAAGDVCLFTPSLIR